jgi:hypothetical protein
MNAGDEPTLAVPVEHVGRSLSGCGRTVQQLGEVGREFAGWDVAYPPAVGEEGDPVILVLRRRSDGARFTATFTSADEGETWKLLGDVMPISSSNQAPG